jgi:HK97 family phage portal protein
MYPFDYFFGKNRTARPRYFDTRASLENPRYGFNDPEILEVLTSGMRSLTGESITPEKMLSVAAVWQAVTLISGDIAKLPLDLYKRGEDGEREKQTGNPLHRLVSRRPSDEMNSFTFWRTAIVHKLIFGNSFQYIERDRAGRPITLRPLNPARTKPKRINGQLVYVTIDNNGMEKPPISPSDILHFREISMNGIDGCETVHYARNVIGLFLAADQYGAEFFNQGGRLGGVLTLPASLKEKKDKVESAFRKMYEGVKNAFKTIVLRDGAAFSPSQAKPGESQLTESKESTVRDVARFYNVAPSRLGLSDSVSYNSKAEDNQAYLDSTLSPHLIEICDELDMKLLKESDQLSGDMYYEHNTRALTQMNTLQRSQIYALQIRCGVLSPDEARAAENMPKRPDGKGGEYVMQSNLVDANPADGRVGNVGNTPIGADNQNPTDGGGSRSVDLQRIIFALAREARHKSKKPHAFRQWIEGNLVNFRAEALQTGMSESDFQSRFDQLSALYKSTAPEALPAAVDEAVTLWETESLLEN